MTISKQILAKIHEDFSTLINDHTYSDLVLVLDKEGSVGHHTHQDDIYDEMEPPEIPQSDFISKDDDTFEEVLSPISRSKSSNLPQSGIAVHRLVMPRRPFFARMFITSGMMESKELVVHLTYYSTEVMLDVLKYLYTDTINLTPRNGIGILFYCIMLDLIDMVSCCRRMVVSLFDNSIIWSIFEIATLYNDKALESECEHYVLARFEELSTSYGFLQLPELSRIKIKQAYEKKKKHQ